MTQEQLNEILNGMDEEERRLYLAADDAYDALYSYQLHKEYGVEVICNPGGDRTKISIDGVIMDHEQFSQWLFGKQLEKAGKEISKSVTEEDEEDYLPTEIEFYELGLDEDATEKEIRRAIKNYTGYFVAKDCELEIKGSTISNIKYGRKASPSELN